MACTAAVTSGTWQQHCPWAMNGTDPDKQVGL